MLKPERKTKTFSIPLFFFKFAYSGFIFIKSEIDLRDLLIALSSKIFPISYKVITIRPSKCSPTKYAPIDEIVIKKFSFILCDFINNFPAFLAVLYNKIAYPKIIIIVVNTLFPILFSIYKPSKAIIIPMINLAT